MQIFPQGAWFGLTRIRLRVILGLSAALLAACTLVYGGARAALLCEAKSAADLLEEMRGIQLGQTEASVMPLVERYEDKHLNQSWSPSGDTHLLIVDPWHLRRRFPGPKWLADPFQQAIWDLGDSRRRLGIRAWVVQATITVSEGKVHSVWAGVMVEGENEWLMGDWVYASEVPPSETNHYKATGEWRPEMSRYFAHWAHLHMGYETGEAIMNWVTPAATAEELNAGRNINLRCLTSLKGCHSLCDLMPDAQQYRRQHGYPELGWNSGSWGPQDRACQ